MAPNLGADLRHRRHHAHHRFLLYGNGGLLLRRRRLPIGRAAGAGAAVKSTEVVRHGRLAVRMAVCRQLVAL